MAAMTNAELSAAIRRAYTEYAQEVAAATDEYDEARRKIAAKRKGRNAAARANRDTQIQNLREQFARERAAALKEAV
jgi:hypothetical protein